MAKTADLEKSLTRNSDLNSLVYSLIILILFHLQGDDEVFSKSVRRKNTKFQKTLNQLNSVSKYNPNMNSGERFWNYCLFHYFVSTNLWDDTDIDSVPSSSVDELAKEMLTLLGFIVIHCYFILFYFLLLFKFYYYYYHLYCYYEIIDLL
jgi:hypothetical protein